MKSYGLLVLGAELAAEAMRILVWMSRFRAPFPERDGWRAEAHETLRGQDGRLCDPGA
ncbi:MAG: hypothetical protein HYZ53_10590 [Planctomycetes bacterium]|nr:hypothetical protein [Planctomycetota bacterium]